MNTLIKHLLGTAECLGQTLSENAAEMMLSKLARYPKEQVLAALDDCLCTLTGKFTLAAILERLKADDGHPSPNEAWLLALAAANPSNRQPLTEPIQHAFKLAKGALDMGDKTGARMGFVETYQRLVAEARQQRKPADWLALPAPAISETWQQNALPKPEINTEKARDNLRQMRDFIRQSATQISEQQSEENEKRRAQLRAKAQHFAALEQHARDLKRNAVNQQAA